MPTPTIQIAQASNGTGSPGSSRDDLLLNQLVTCTDPANPSGSVWSWVLFSKPPGSGAVLAGASTDTATFTPDVAGTYLIRLTVDGQESWTTIRDGDLNNFQTESTQGGCGIKFADGTRPPAAGETHEFSTAVGWHDTMYEFMSRVAARLPTADEKTDLGQLADAPEGTVWYANSLGRVTRLPPGVDGEVLTLVSGLPNWEPSVGGGGGTLDAAYDFGGAGAGRTVSADAGSVLFQNVVANDDDVFTVAKQPAGAQAGYGVYVTMNNNTTSSGIFVDKGGSGTGVTVSNTGTGIALDVYQTLASGTSPGLQVTAAGAATGSNLVMLAEASDGIARTGSLLRLNRWSDAATGPSIRIDHNGSGSAFHLDYAGAGAGIDVTVDGASTAAQAMRLDETAGVVRTSALLDIARSADSTGPSVYMNHDGSGNAFRIDHGGGADAISVNINGSDTTPRGLFIGESAAVARTNNLLRVDRTSTIATGAAGVIDNNGLGMALAINQGNASGSAYGIYLTVDGASAGSGAISILETAVARNAPLISMNRDAATSGNSIYINHNGTGDALDIDYAGAGSGIDVTVDGASTVAEGLRVDETTGVVRTAALATISRSADSTGPALSISHVGTGSNAVGINVGRGGTIGETFSQDVQGIRLVTEQSAALNAQQYSPVLGFRAKGWATDTSTSYGTEFGVQLQPVQGTAVITSNLVFGATVNQQALLEVFRVGNLGDNRMTHRGAGDALGIDLIAANTSGQALVITETAQARTEPLVEITRDAAATGYIAQLSAADLSSTTLFDAGTDTLAGNLVDQGGLHLTNPTAATDGTRMQNSPALVFTGAAWDAFALSSRPLKAFIGLTAFNAPTGQDFTDPYPRLDIWMDPNDGTPTRVASFNSERNFDVPGISFSGGGGGITWWVPSTPIIVSATLSHDDSVGVTELTSPNLHTNRIRPRVTATDNTGSDLGDGSTPRRWKDYYGSRIDLIQPNKTNGTPKEMVLGVGGTHTTLAEAEAVDVRFNLARTVEFAGDEVTPWVLATQRAVLITAPTYASDAVGISDPEGGGTTAGVWIDDAATLAISGAPISGSNVSLRRSHALWIQSGNSLFAGKVETHNTSDVEGDIEFRLRSADPTTPRTGDLWYRNDLDAIRYWDGATTHTLATDTDVAGAGVTLDGAYDFGGAGAGRIVTVDSQRIEFNNDAANGNGVLRISKQPAASQGGHALLVEVGINATSNGVRIEDARATATESNAPLSISSPGASNGVGHFGRQLALIDTRDPAIGTGGKVTFYGVETTGGNPTTFAQIGATKANATSGNREADCVISTRNDGSSDLSEALRVSAVRGINVTAGGSAGAPAVSCGATNIGMYLFSASPQTLGFATGGGNRLQINSSGLFVTTSGTAGTPAIRLNDTDTGLYLASTDVVGIAGGGQPSAQFAADGMHISVSGDTTTPAIRINDTNSGFTGGDNVVSVVAGGITDVQFLAGTTLFTRAARPNPSTLTWGANVAVNAQLSNYYTLTLSGATAQLDNPTAVAEGMSWSIKVVQDGTGGRDLTFDTNYDWGDEGEFDASAMAAGEIAVLSFIAFSTTHIAASARGGF